MNALSLYSGGCDGLSLAASWVGIDTVAYCDSELSCRAVLRARHPDAPIFESDEDVTIDGLRAAGIDPNRIDLVMGGPPCQIASVAGKRMGASDPRNRWPEFLRICRVVRPRWVLAENVPGLLSVSNGRLFGDILRDLAQMGYRVSWGCWGAADVGAPHGRERLFIIGKLGDAGCAERRASQSAGDVADRDDARWEEAAGRTGASSADEQLADAGHEQPPRRREATSGSQREPCGQFTSCGVPGHVADAHRERQQQPRGEQPQSRGRAGNGGEVADAASAGLQERTSIARESAREASRPERCGGMEHAESARCDQLNAAAIGHDERQPDRGPAEGRRARPTEPGLDRDAARLPSWLDQAARRLAAQRWPHPRMKDGPSPQYDWEPPRVATGIPDRAARLRMIGNSCPPQQYLVALAVIAEAESIEMEANPWMGLS